MLASVKVRSAFGLPLRGARAGRTAGAARRRATCALPIAPR